MLHQVPFDQQSPLLTFEQQPNEQADSKLQSGENEGAPGEGTANSRQAQGGDASKQSDVR